MSELSFEDKKILLDIQKENDALLRDILSIDPTAKRNPLLEKALLLRFLHVSRLYKKLGGRFAKEFGPEINEGIKEVARAVETAKEEMDPHQLSKAKELLPKIKTKIDSLLKQ